MAIDITVHLTNEAQSTIESVRERINTEITARNSRIQADKDRAAANGMAYVGPEPEPLKTLPQVVQLRFDQTVQNDILQRASAITSEWARTFLSKDAATQRAMLLDMAKYQTAPVLTRDPGPGTDGTVTR